MSLEPSLSVNDVVTAEFKYMEEIGNVQGPEKHVARAEMSLVPRSLEASSTVLLTDDGQIVNCACLLVVLNCLTHTG